MDSAIPAALRDPRAQAEFVRQGIRKLALADDFAGVCQALRYTPNPVQARLHAARHAEHRVLVSGRQAGKTLGAAVEIVHELLRGDGAESGQVLLVGPVHDLAEKAFRTVRDILERQLGFTFEARQDSKGGRLLRMPWGAELRCGSDAAEDSLLGGGYDLIVVDEAARMRAQTWERILEPMLGIRDGRALFLSTPLAAGSWFYDLYQMGEDPNEPDWVSIHGETAENPFFPAEKLARIKARISPETFEREYCGRFVSLAGRIYREFDPAAHISTEAEYDPRFPVLVTVDFGATMSSPFALSVSQLRPPGVLFVTHEFVIGGVSTTEAAQRLAQWWGQVGLPKGETRLATCDIAGKDARLHLERALAGTGILPAYVRTNKQSVDDGIERVRQRLRAETLIIHPRCRVMAEEFQAYSYRQATKDGLPEPGVEKRFDHLLDGLRYLVTELDKAGAIQPMAGKPEGWGTRRDAAMYREECAARNARRAQEEHDLAAWRAERQKARGEEPGEVPPPPPRRRGRLVASSRVRVGNSDPDRSLMRSRGGIQWRPKQQ